MPRVPARKQHVIGRTVSHTFTFYRYNVMEFDQPITNVIRWLSAHNDGDALYCTTTTSNPFLYYRPKWILDLMAFTLRLITSLAQRYWLFI
jgi:hypothetical protein